MPVRIGPSERDGATRVGDETNHDHVPVGAALHLDGRQNGGGLLDPHASSVNGRVQIVLVLGNDCPESQGEARPVDDRHGGKIVLVVDGEVRR